MLNKPTSEINDPGVYLNKIDSLESTIDSLRTKKDSVDRRIDTVKCLIDDIHNNYEETRTSIIHNNVTDDYLFFTEYLNKNRARLDSINNSESTKRN